MISIDFILNVIERQMKQHRRRADTGADRLCAGDLATKHAAVVSDMPRVYLHHQVMRAMKVPRQYEGDIEHVCEYSRRTCERIDREASEFT